jgi:serine/threonine-protein kinase RsbT
MEKGSCEMTNVSDGKLTDIYVGSYEDIIFARQKIRFITQEIGFSLLDQTRIITSVSELGRNIVVHAKEGYIFVYKLTGKEGLKIVFEDKGPGISDICKAMEAGFSTVDSLGLGLSGSKNLLDKFDIKSIPGKGTTVTIIKWL